MNRIKWLNTKTILIISIVIYACLQIGLMIINRNSTNMYSLITNNTGISKALNIKISSMDELVNLISKISKFNTVIFFGTILFVSINFIEKKECLKNYYRYRYIIVGLMFIISVFILKINFSSFRAYEMVLPNNINYVKEVHIGDYRTIRSDEWGVLTPLQLSQEGNDYSGKSDLLGEKVEIDSISGGIPTKELSMIGKPFLWGYVLFGSEIGFSWYSVSKILLLLIFSYKLIDVLTKDKKLAVVGSFIIGFSPGIQWWFTTNALTTEIIVSWEMIIVSLYKIFSNTSNKVKYINGSILLISTIGFTVALYPPFQVPLAYFGIALLIGLYLDNRNDIKFNKVNLVILILVIILYILVISITVLGMLPEIKKIMGTVYPGKRIGRGGTLIFEYLFNYLPTLFLPFKDITYSNASEVSSFITLFPIPLVVYFLDRKNYKSNIIMSIVSFIIGTLIFMYIGIPSVISKITLMSFVTEKRLYVIFGLACTILMICMTKSFLTEKNSKNNVPWRQLFLSILIGYYVYRHFGDVSGYIGKKFLLLSTCLFFILTYYFNKNRNIFIKLILVITIIVGATINPVNFGMREIKETPFSSAVREINKDDPGKWITTNDLWLSKYILAQGVQVLNALNYPPMLYTWGILDKNKESLDVYNRYAHIIINLDENPQKTFELVQTDVFKVNISTEQAIELGIKYIATKQEINGNLNHVKLIYTDPLDNTFIYKINQS